MEPDDGMPAPTWSSRPPATAAAPGGGAQGPTVTQGQSHHSPLAPGAHQPPTRPTTATVEDTQEVQALQATNAALRGELATVRARIDTLQDAISLLHMREPQVPTPQLTAANQQAPRPTHTKATAFDPSRSSSRGAPASRGGSSSGGSSGGAEPPRSGSNNSNTGSGSTPPSDQATPSPVPLPAGPSTAAPTTVGGHKRGRSACSGEGEESGPPTTAPRWASTGPAPSPRLTGLGMLQRIPTGTLPPVSAVLAHTWGGSGDGTASSTSGTAPSQAPSTGSNGSRDFQPQLLQAAACAQPGLVAPAPPTAGVLRPVGYGGPPAYMGRGPGFAVAPAPHTSQPMMYAQPAPVTYAPPTPTQHPPAPPAASQRTIKGKMEPWERVRVQEFVDAVKARHTVVARGDLARCLRSHVNPGRPQLFFEKLISRKRLNQELGPLLAPRRQRRSAVDAELLDSIRRNPQLLQAAMAHSTGGPKAGGQLLQGLPPPMTAPPGAAFNYAQPPMHYAGRRAVGGFSLTGRR